MSQCSRNQGFSLDGQSERWRSFTWKRQTRGQACIPQARLKLLALITSDHERLFNGWAAGTRERIQGFV